ncbi:uncharacterized protein LOC121604428 [Chelmon rostratus]|uniref:uncharacterized protein LOC121604428 n=1 Tax=Chelmon rostratus TaxID=109905 RepID=UPI001BE8EB7D|nr:uncharacterized protein LOC121604428 [Chelmon rostratus]
MKIVALHIPLWLLTALTLTTQELVKLSVSPHIAAECGKAVALNCNVSSSRNELSIKRMQWLLNKKSLCSVDSDRNMRTDNGHATSGFHCEYSHGQLSLIFENMQPVDSGGSNSYMCKLQSNQGVEHASTTVELEECCGIVEGVLTSDSHICTFKHVHPDGDVHWFHGPRNLSDGTPHNTTKQWDKGGWLTIRSHLQRKGSDGPYSCFLTSTKSGRAIATTLVQNSDVLRKSRARAQGPTTVVWNGAGSQGPIRTCLYFLISVAFTLT